MKFQFSHQDYQARAVEAVVKIFHGQPLAEGDFSLMANNGSVSYAADGSIGNELKLSDDQFLTNLRAVQEKNFSAANGSVDPKILCNELLGDSYQVTDGDKRINKFCPHFSIEMETGTGKTYAFIKTMYELNKLYGFKKFVVVVPRVAIREGTMKN